MLAELVAAAADLPHLSYRYSPTTTTTSTTTTTKQPTTTKPPSEKQCSSRYYRFIKLNLEGKM
jgi:hypothetical protein